MRFLLGSCKGLYLPTNELIKQFSEKVINNFIIKRSPRHPVTAFNDRQNNRRITPYLLNETLRLTIDLEPELVCRLA